MANRIDKPKNAGAGCGNNLPSPKEHQRCVGHLSEGAIGSCTRGALLHDPETLILDEPTSGLDLNQIVEIRQAIRNVVKPRLSCFLLT